MKSFRWWMVVVVLAAGAGAFSLARAAVEENYGSEMKTNALLALQVLGDDFVSPSAAVDKARGAAKGVPSEVELATIVVGGKHVVVWEAELDAGTAIHKVAVDAKSGEVLKVWDDAEDADDAGKAAKLLEGKKTDLKGALAAISDLKAGLLLGLQVEDDEGTAVFSVFTTRDGRMAEHQVDATTGKVVTEDAEKSGDEKKESDEDGD